jgi:hypothetical protein
MRAVLLGRSSLIGNFFSLPIFHVLRNHCHDIHQVTLSHQPATVDAHLLHDFAAASGLIGRSCLICSLVKA